MTASEILTKLRENGIALKTHGARLFFFDGSGKMTPALKAQVRTHKPQIIDLVRAPKQEIINRVAQGFDLLTHQEFTNRFLILMRAWREGIIDDPLRDEGLEFLLDHWDYAKQTWPQ